MKSMILINGGGRWPFLWAFGRTMRWTRSSLCEITSALPIWSEGPAGSRTICYDLSDSSVARPTCVHALIHVRASAA
ncbi:hypothetical protein M5689_005828 [Euphorbia peplus]|nr:hypothetical protein M5689_005828 [Euphorbia peplus]